MSSSTSSTFSPDVVFHGNVAPNQEQEEREHKEEKERAIEMQTHKSFEGGSSSSSSSSSSSFSPSPSPSPDVGADAGAGAAGAGAGSGAGAEEESDDVDGRIGLLLSYASKDNVERMTTLLDNGLSPNVADYDKRTALHLAAAEGKQKALELLIERGADINVRDRFNNSPLDDATTHGHVDIVSLLVARGAQHGTLRVHEAALIEAASAGDVNKLKMLIEAGVSPNCADYDGRTPLHLAVAEQKVEAIKYLLEKQADPNAEDRWGLTPVAEGLRLATRTGTDPLKGIFDKYLPASVHRRLTPFSIFFILTEFIIIILIGLFCRYDATNDGSSANQDPAVQWPSVYQVYPLYQDVHVMIFIGFGFLMVFLRKNSYTSVGFTFLIGAFCIQWYQLTSGFWQGVLAGHFQQLPINISKLVQGDFAAGSVLITFGVVLGKVGPFQMMIVALIETCFYSLNEAIALQLGISDIGGTMIIHMFGAFFGMALSMVSTPKEAHGNPHNAAVYHSDTMAMIGTIFLWLFWPSFNGALAVGAVQHRCIVNTVLGLTGSCVMAFLMSHVLRGEEKFNMVDIQNATLSGGVALGACCDMLVSPGSAIAIGAIAGAVSVAGYVFIQPFLEAKIGLHDTCGVNNLHGMPSLIGGFAAVIASSQAYPGDYGELQFESIFSTHIRSRSANNQAAYQFAFMCISVGMGLSAGSLTGLIIKWSIFNPTKQADKMFVDSNNWEVPHLEIPYYFDHRGEVSRGKANSALPDVDQSAAAAAPGSVSIQIPSQVQAHQLRLNTIEQQLQTIIKKQSSHASNHAHHSDHAHVHAHGYQKAASGHPDPHMIPPYPFMPYPPMPMPMPMMPFHQPQYQYPSSSPLASASTSIPASAQPGSASGSGSSNLERMMELLITKLDRDKKD